MRILSIDTTSLYGSIALTDGGVTLCQINDGPDGSHSKRLISNIDALLKKANLETGDLQGIAVAVGPGSFTGLRIGLATAKGMALSLGIPIVGVSSLRSLAENARDSKKIVLPLIDARRGEIYSAAYEFAEGRPMALFDECALKPSDLIERVLSLEGEVFAVGDGAIVYRDLLSSGLGRAIEFADEVKTLPSASNLAFLAVEKLAVGGDDLTLLAPNYIRVSDAEIGFLGKN